jgi:integrase
VTRNVAALARPPRRTQREIEYLHPAQLRTLLAACESDPIGPLVTVAATTGLRQGELLGLTWSDVEEGTLTVRRALARARDGGWELSPPKTSRSRRSVRLPAAAVAAFARQRELQEQDRAAVGNAWQDVEGIVFTDPVGRYLRGYNVTKAFQKLLMAASLPSVPFHALRHSAATALLSEGVPLRVVADVLGHSTIVVTANVYAAVVPELRREAADAMNRALARGGGDASSRLTTRRGCAPGMPVPFVTWSAPLTWPSGGKACPDRTGRRGACSPATRPARTWRRRPLRCGTKRGGARGDPLG